MPLTANCFYKRLAIFLTFSLEDEMFEADSEKVSMPLAICFSVMKICSLELSSCET